MSLTKTNKIIAREIKAVDAMPEYNVNMLSKISISRPELRGIIIINNNEYDQPYSSMVFMTDAQLIIGTIKIVRRSKMTITVINKKLYTVRLTSGMLRIRIVDIKAMSGNKTKCFPKNKRYFGLFDGSFLIEIIFRR